MPTEDELRLTDLKLSDEEPGDAAPTPRSRTPGGAARGVIVDQDAIDDSLRAELAGVRQINSVISGVVTSIQTARSNMDTISTTVNNANKLLDLWVKILSQTEHTQRLLLSESWTGLSNDQASIEAEEAARRAEHARRVQEAKERAEAREREAAAAEARRLLQPVKGIRKGASGARGRGAGGVSSKYGLGGSTLPNAIGRGGRGGAGAGTSGRGSGRGGGTAGSTRGRGRGVR